MPTLAPVLARDVNLSEYELLGGRGVLPPDPTATRGLRQHLGVCGRTDGAAVDTRHQDVTLR